MQRSIYTLTSRLGKYLFILKEEMKLKFVQNIRLLIGRNYEMKQKGILRNMVPE